ncbi:unnamed protein product [Closterium sp. Naga37s-1]|nr:unnamed protein product [Closterium sp. Naga37s-1]
MWLVHACDLASDAPMRQVHASTMVAASGAAAAGTVGGAAASGITRQQQPAQLAGQQRLAKYQVELRPVHVSTMVAARRAAASVVKQGGARWGEVPEGGANGSFGGGAVTICAAPTSCPPRGWLSHRRALHVSPVSGPLSSVPGLTSLTQACGGSPSLASAASEWPSRAYHASPPSLSLTTEALPELLSSLTTLRHLDLSHNRLSSPALHLTSALPHLQ